MEHRRSQSIVQDKIFRFAVQIVGYIRQQPNDRVNLVLNIQLLRSGTSIGANVEEAQAGQSRPDFISKNSIALKEARECPYWLRLLIAAKIMPEKRLAELRDEADEIKRILGSIVVRTKKRIV